MWDFILPWLLLAGIPLGLALLCGFIQKLLAARLDGETKALRPLLLGILPLTLGLLSLYMLFKVFTITGWDMLGWGLLLFWTGSALIGTLFGWGMGNDKRKKKEGVAMSDAIVLAAVLAGIPLGLAVLCGTAQGLLAYWLKNEILRAVLVAILPSVSGLATLYTFVELLSASGWDNIGWGIYLLWAGAAFLGTLLGWLIGALCGRKR